MWRHPYHPKCARGEGHQVFVLTVTYPDHRTRQFSVRRERVAEVRRLHPELFDRKHPNPWDDFTLKSRTKSKKHAVTGEEVYKFA